MNSNKIGIIGASGCGKDILCCLLDIFKLQEVSKESISFYDSNPELLSKIKILGINVYPFLELNVDDTRVIIAVANGNIRRQVRESLPIRTNFKNIIHPSSIVSEFANLADGFVISAGTIITCNVNIGVQSQLNIKTSIAHDCTIGDYFTTGPGASINGNCTIGNNVYVGSNACIRQGINICDDVTIGMGAVVVKNISAPGVYIGNPSRKLEK